jgi:hypothetical protein
MAKQLVGNLSVKKASFHTHVSVTMRGFCPDVQGGTLIKTVVIESETPLPAMAVGERVTISNLFGFSATHAVAVVKNVAHVVTGDAMDFRHVTLIDLDEAED